MHEDIPGLPKIKTTEAMKATQKQLSSEGINHATKGDPTKIKTLENIESNLLQLNLDKDKLKAEFDKIPDNAKTIA